jgi:hypothetical protein
LAVAQAKLKVKPVSGPTGTGFIKGRNAGDSVIYLKILTKQLN